MNEVLAVAIITLLAVISPGADFAMVTRNSILQGRKAGLLSATGIALGVQLHVMYTMLGVGLLIGHTPWLFTTIKLCGAAYLVYIGVQTFRQEPHVRVDLHAGQPVSAWGAFKTGFLTNALNPKTTLFVVSTYTQVVHADTPLSLQFGYGLFMSFAHWAWFSLVSLFFSHDGLRGAMLSMQRLLNRLIGSVLIGLGGTLALSPMMH
ncbi:LysE family translocator [Chromobacterium paludis]|uniref:LysE family translocator n=1 Tax=Chromobacterium paludis TaxID=2605945 RepID=A0A5C1DGE4_9NEIS|nr:LysE family transporter [Chromobacterium paludis]QEL54668.1 LysE family translocator [Chromobacterium paludis]